jgi:uncharacterized lipoprotein YddW (UPF0748 family)
MNSKVSIWCRSACVWSPKRSIFFQITYICACTTLDTMINQFRPFIVTLSLFCLLFTQLSGQAPTAELRGAWIASVANIDWPSQPGLSSERQKYELDSMLDVLKGMGMNAVFMQIRPNGDALYPNTYAPWSKWLTGKQGTPPSPYYDPLDYAIKAAHSRKMELHAWLNPYRATFDGDTTGLALTHLFKSLPPDYRKQWMFKYGNRYYLNPANPSVIDHLTEIVGDVITRYNVDGIHFDDYFYPYKEAGESLNDYAEFVSYPRGFTNIDDWRRDNVSRLIEKVSKRIKQQKPYVKFGISPFGVWRNKDKDPVRGSDTKAGLTCYDDLYADVLLWLEKDWIDYVAPQLYWSIGFAPADYQKLVGWWGKNTYGKHLYIGQATYKVGNSNNDPNWNLPSQTSNQVALNRSSAPVKGSIYFSAKQLLKNPLGVADTLRNNLYAYNALQPAMDYRSTTTAATPRVCHLKGTPSTIKLGWHACNLSATNEVPYYFAVYRFFGKELGDFSDPANLISITEFNTEDWVFEDKRVYAGEYYTYVVVGLNRYHVPGYSSNPILVKKTKKKVRVRSKLFGIYLPWHKMLSNR